MREKQVPSPFAEDRPICVVGNGRLGTALCGGLVRAGYRILSLAARSLSPDDLERCAELPIVASDLSKIALSEFGTVFLALPDSAIADFVRQTEWRAGQLVVHCSGALDRTHLLSAAQSGAKTASLHPIQTFSTGWLPADIFAGITFGVEAEGETREYLKTMARRLGGRAIEVPGESKATYHVAAVLASNYVVSLMSSAFAVWDRIEPGNPESAAKALLPIAWQALENVAAQGGAEALTGPISRADLPTIEAHLNALNSHDRKISDLYRCLGNHTLEQALAAGRLDAKQAHGIRELLTGNARPARSER